MENQKPKVHATLEDLDAIQRTLLDPDPKRNPEYAGLVHKEEFRQKVEEILKPYRDKISNGETLIPNFLPTVIKRRMKVEKILQQFNPPPHELSTRSS